MIIRNQIKPIGGFLGKASGIDESLLGNEGVHRLRDVWLDGVCDDGDDAVAVWD